MGSPPNAVQYEWGWSIAAFYTDCLAYCSAPSRKRPLYWWFDDMRLSRRRMAMVDMKCYNITYSHGGPSRTLEAMSTQ